MSNQINGNLEKISREQTLCKSYRTLKHVVKRGLSKNTVKSMFTKPKISEDS